MQSSLFRCIARGYTRRPDPNYPAAELFYQKALQCPHKVASIHLSSVLGLSHLRVLTGRPREAADLIESSAHWLQQALTEDLSDEDLRRDLSCVYAQARGLNDNYGYDNVTALTAMLSPRNASICSMLLRHSRLMSDRSLSDALRSADEFAASFPAAFESHAARGEALLALDRIPQARIALEIAYLLMTRRRSQQQQQWSDLFHSYYAQHDQLKLRTAILYAQSLLLQANESGMEMQAGRVLRSAISDVDHPSGVDPLQCELLSQAADLQCGLRRVGEAFVTRQLMRQYCGDDDDDAGTVDDDDDDDDDDDPGTVDDDDDDGDPGTVDDDDDDDAALWLLPI